MVHSREEDSQILLPRKVQFRIDNLKIWSGISRCAFNNVPNKAKQGHTLFGKFQSLLGTNSSGVDFLTEIVNAVSSRPHYKMLFLAYILLNDHIMPSSHLFQKFIHSHSMQPNDLIPFFSFSLTVRQVQVALLLSYGVLAIYIIGNIPSMEIFAVAAFLVMSRAGFRAWICL